MNKLTILLIVLITNLFIGTSFAMQPPDSLDKQLLDAAAQSVDKDLIPKLIAQGADVNYVSQPSLQTPLYIAAYFGEPYNVNVLLLDGADPNAGIGALIGLLRGLDANTIKDKKAAIETASLLLYAHANYNEPIVQNFIKTKPALEKFLNSIIQLSQKKWRAQKLS